MIGSNLLRYRPDQRYLIFDVETEGLHLARTRPWQLAYAVCTLKGIESINVRHLNWPDLNVSLEAARVTRFDMATHMRIAEDPETVLRDFEALVNDPQYILTGHNILGFDAYVYQTWRRLCGRSLDWSFMPRMLDTNVLSKAYRKGFKPEHDNLPAWQYKVMAWREKGLKTRLGVMAREFGIEYDERYAHDAAYDVRVNHGVLNKLVWSIEV